MKKILALLLVSIMALSLVACGGNNANAETNDNQTSQTETSNESNLTEQQQMVVDATNQVLASDSFKEIVSAYEEASQSEAKEPKVVQAIDYQLDDFNGYKVDVMLIKLQADVMYDNAIYKDFQILVDKESGEVYDKVSLNVAEWSNSFDGTCKSEEDVKPMLLMCYSFLEQNGLLWADSETLVELTEADLEVNNNNLK